VAEEIGKDVAEEIGAQIISSLVQGGEWAFAYDLISGANYFPQFSTTSSRFLAPAPSGKIWNANQQLHQLPVTPN
jgi:hypothetical protein